MDFYSEKKIRNKKKYYFLKIHATILKRDLSSSCKRAILYTPQ